MLSVEAARAVMLAAMTRTAPEEIALDEGFGRVLAAPIIAPRDQPPFPASSMDGYAVRAVDTPGVLKLVGEAAAGHAFERALGAGEAVRISTGAAIPEGADAVLIQEDARIESANLLAPAVRPGQNVRRRGGDFRGGETLLSSGARLDAGAVMLAASAGYAKIVVARAPRIAILAGGDEIVAPGATPRPDQVHDSASFGVAALARDWGGAATRWPLIPDRAEDFARAARSALQEADLLVVIGGASVGPHDHARAALRSLELERLVDAVSVKPGKPTWFGRTPLGLVLGLPGNPASALVCARLFLAPMIECMLGCAQHAASRRARLTHALPANGAREHYLRAVLSEDGLDVTPWADQDSSLATVLARSNVLIRRMAGAPSLPADTHVPVLLWRLEATRLA